MDKELTENMDKNRPKEDKNRRKVDKTYSEWTITGLN